MANPFSTSSLIGSPPMAVRTFAFSRPLIPHKAISGQRKVRCFCAVKSDGNPAQAAANGGAVQTQIKCNFTNKVYEDRAKGIACYIDEKGEIICEGYDDGLRTEAPCPFGNLRDGNAGVDVIELLERSWLQSASGS